MIVLRSLFGKRGAPRTAPGERVYAIGDVHGRPDLLDAMLVEIARHGSARGPAAQTHIVFIGDIIDRGPDSRGALERLEAATRRAPEIVTLLGNHEEMMLRALAGDEPTLRGWMRVGGAETVASFGLPPFAEAEDPVPWIAELRRAVPAEWVEWIRGWPLIVRSGDYFLCHAGIKPGVPLKRQLRRDFLWSREEFLDDMRDHGAVIVHGHTISDSVELRGNRIGIDTGAYRTGTLSAVCLDGETVEVLAVHRGEAAA
ncbi:metallophosphoesterase family protein [Sphingomonas jatrophae]|uniref:Serine/threonine protein phosphatase 1 n=1 Tax=Sphingomonas jatrophae TaxID=1166337 RepID=A0A1I6M5M4_9SPHN|nr:metallophosphoesterase family protein [Sphingomonas jatrophae]SFS11010.1 serine/threonine protein phosphatase 1 [Sphingomonas jatrophae]